MKTMRAYLLASAVGFGFACRAVAGSIAAAPAGEPIMPGEWHLSLTKALAVAQETDIPVLGFWSSTGCSRCSEWSAFAGVLLPGWLGAECQTGCADNEGELLPKPFGMGAYWFLDKVPVERTGGHALILFSAGHPLVIEKAEE